MALRLQRRLANSWLNSMDHLIQFLGSEIDKKFSVLRKHSNIVGTTFDTKFISMGDLAKDSLKGSSKLLAIC